MQVNLEERLFGYVIEKACINAAKELGYEAVSHDKYSKVYRLGSVHKEEVYDETYITVNKVEKKKQREKKNWLLSLFFPQVPEKEVEVRKQVLEIISIKKGESRDWFMISDYNLGPEAQVEEYLSSVSRHLATVS